MEVAGGGASVYETLTGVRLGSGGGAVKARIYDRTEENRLKGSDWWPDN